MRPCLCCWLSPGTEGSKARFGVRQPRSRVGNDAQQHPSRRLTSPRAVCPELSTYSLEAPLNTRLLERVAQEAVLHLDETPCLHSVSLANGTEFTRRPFPESLPTMPQPCQGVGELVHTSEPELVVLVQRVPDVASLSPRPCWNMHMEADRMGHRETETPRVLQLWPQLTDTQLRNNLVAGKVGDCCDGEDDHKHGELNLNGTDVRSTSHGVRTSHEDVAFWGVVIQSPMHTGVEGCYLLKTARNVDLTGCTCTHFSMTRVCQDTPLCKQYQAAWLV